MEIIENIYKAPLKSPLSVCIWISDSCNLACKYCYAMPFSGKFMESKRLFSLIDELVDLQVIDFTFAGGEPMIHPEIFTILERLAEKNVQIGVLTNGVNLNDETITRLRSLFDNKGKFLLQVSLDSLNPEDNDFVRGRGATVIKNLEKVAEAKFSIQLSTVVSKININYAHLIIEKFYPKIKRFHFLNIQKTATSLQHPEILITEAESKAFWTNLNEYSKRFPTDLDLPSLNTTMRSYGSDNSALLHQSATMECKTCTAGITHVEIDHNFNILGCDIAKDFSKMGNVRDKSFQEVWHSKQAYDLRNTELPACYFIEKNQNKVLIKDLEII